MGAEELAGQLRAIAEELGEMALDCLRRAAEDAGAGQVDPKVLAAERRLTRARRAVEKAASLLEGPEGR